MPQAAYNFAMVSVVHSVAGQGDPSQILEQIAEGLGPAEAGQVRQAADFACAAYGDELLGSGESMREHALGMALIVTGLRLDAEARMAALLFCLPACDEQAQEKIEQRFGKPAAHLVAGISKLNHLRPITRGFVADTAENPQEMRAQIEVLRKMLLAMVEDIRVVLLRLASRTQTLRYYAAHPDDLRIEVARETLELYSPLANRLGVWELKWELEDLSFRFLHPETYKSIARQLDEKRTEREQFIADAIDRLRDEVETAGIRDAEIYGRPKHIYSIWNKMRKKGVDFSEVYDVRAVRVIVDEIKDCYTVLGIVHNLWTPIPKEFDDYISNPKGNHYRSLHTAVHCPDGRSLEVQIRTREMHRHAELGVAAHWRYKEGGKKGNEVGYDEKIAWLRQLLSWKDEVSDSSDWVKHYKQAALDETIYLLTPAGKVVDLPAGSTPIDFAYRVHTDLGHRCRGAKVNGALVPLNTSLQTGQRVEIVAAKEGGPSRDWLNAELGYLASSRAKSKVRAWFNTQHQRETIARGREMVEKLLQREGRTAVSLEGLASQLGYKTPDALFETVGKDELSLRSIETVLKPPAPQPDPDAQVLLRKPRAGGDAGGVLVVGLDSLLTQTARCCKPAPPDPIAGYVTRGRGVSVHRQSCAAFRELLAREPERVIDVAWSRPATGHAPAYPVDVGVEAVDRQGLLRDISDVFAREKMNVIGVQTQSVKGWARMTFTVEVSDTQRLTLVLRQVKDVAGVRVARRR